MPEIEYHPLSPFMSENARLMVSPIILAANIFIFNIVFHFTPLP